MKLGKFLTGTALAAAIVLLPGCGGGGGGGGDDIPEPTTVITKDNAEVVTASTIDAVVDTTDGVGDIPILYSIDDSPKVDNLTLLILSKLNKNIRYTQAIDTRSVETRESGTEPCTNGGSFSYNGNEETGGTVVFNNCKEDGITMNGKLVFRLENGEILKSYTAENFSFVEENGFKMTLNQANVSFEYSNDVDFPDAIKTDITGSMDIPSSYAEEDMPAGHYALSHMRTYLTGLNGGEFTIEANGMLQTPCTNGWIEVKTLKTVKGPDLDSCPTEGEMAIIGAENSEVDVIFESNTSVTLKLNGEVFKTYESCEEMPTGCSIAK